MQISERGISSVATCLMAQFGQIADPRISYVAFYCSGPASPLRVAGSFPPSSSAAASLSALVTNHFDLTADANFVLCVGQTPPEHDSAYQVVMENILGSDDKVCPMAYSVITTVSRACISDACFGDRAGVAVTARLEASKRDGKVTLVTELDVTWAKFDGYLHRATVHASAKVPKTAAAFICTPIHRIYSCVWRASRRDA